MNMFTCNYCLRKGSYAWEDDFGGLLWLCKPCTETLDFVRAMIPLMDEGGSIVDE